MEIKIPDGLENSQTGEDVAKVQQVNEAVAKAGGIAQQKPLSKSAQDKLKKAEEQYWKSMITRGEATKMMQAMEEELMQKIRVIFIQNKTLVDFIISKGMTTQDELDELSKPVIELIYGKQPVNEAPPETIPVSELDEVTTEDNIVENGQPDMPSCDCCKG